MGGDLLGHHHLIAILNRHVQAQIAGICDFLGNHRIRELHRQIDLGHSLWADTDIIGFSGPNFLGGSVQGLGPNLNFATGDIANGLTALAKSQIQSHRLTVVDLVDGIP